MLLGSQLSTDSLPSLRDYLSPVSAGISCGPSGTGGEIHLGYQVNKALILTVGRSPGTTDTSILGLDDPWLFTHQDLYVFTLFSEQQAY